MEPRHLLAVVALTGGLLVTTAPAAAAPGGETTLAGTAQVSVDQRHSCLRLGSQARCWGSNYDGEIGDGTDVYPVTTPAVVKNPAGTGPLTGVVSVEAGIYGSCAVLGTGQARCWGYNGEGEVGDGTDVDYRFLARVVRNHSDSGPLTGVVRIAAGYNHACALLDNGQVRCWGANVVGELGTGSPGPDQNLPQVVLNRAGTGPLTGVTQIDAGYQRTCVRLENGQARCWGNNERGALGNGVPGNAALPVVVANVAGTGPLTGVTQVTVGNGHGCARLANGGARCWGSNGSGQVGDGTSGTDRLRPVVVRNATDTAPLAGVTQIDVGHYATCARLGNGQIRCWGLNDDGQIGDGTTGTDRLLPTVVTNPAGSAPLANVIEVQAAQDHACARLVGGELRCWGGNDAGQVGDGTFGTDRLRPRRVQA